jgi:squalene-associated FAD-dependent desaturase
VVVIGGGLAGLATATALAPSGLRVTLVESRGRLGGRASSFTDITSGQLIDTCQHVTMGCCTNLAHFFRTVGIDHFLEPQPDLFFMTPDRRVSRFRAGPWPAPFHLLPSFLAAHYLTVGDKLRIARGLIRLRQENGLEDPPFVEWLARHGQTERTVHRFWSVVLTSALNETPDRIGLRYARKVFVEGFLDHRRGFEVSLPTVPLGRLYGQELRDWFNQHQIDVRCDTGIRMIQVTRQRVAGLELRSGAMLNADWYVAAVPFDRLLNLLPAEVVQENDVFARLHNFETSPITSVHCWYDRPVMTWPHLVLIDGIGQWVFNRQQSEGGEHYLQVVVSAARQFRGLGHEEVQRRVVAELARLLPQANPQRLIKARVVTEHAATFSAVPGVDRLRPGQETPLENLFLAGDWTATGWPATMEGAVRSGYLAAEKLLDRLGRLQNCLQPNIINLSVGGPLPRSAGRKPARAGAWESKRRVD